MPNGRMIPATPEQVARYGHIAAALREALTQRGWNTHRLQTEIGLKGTGAYSWVNAKGGPSITARKALKRLFPEIDSKTWQPRDFIEPKRETGREIGPLVNKVPEIMSVNVTLDGRARIRLDVTLPVTDAMPLIRMLFDQGLISREVQHGSTAESS